MMFLNFAMLFASTAIIDVRSDGIAPLLKLNNGREIPGFGIGTWLGFAKSGGAEKPVGDEVERAVSWAIDAGYRHVDTAYIYSTEQQVGRAVNAKIAEGVIKREDIFVTTKLWNTFHEKEAVVPALKKSLKQLNMEYVDLYLIHWPIALHDNGSISTTDYLDTWKGMVEALNQGLTRSIGVSNFNQHQLDRIISLSPVKPAVLQVELNLNLQQPALLSFCRQHDIAVMGYTPFGSLFYSKAEADAPPPRVDDPALVLLADKYNKTVPQVVLRYLVESGVIPIPKSVTQARVEQNLQVFDFKLTPQERKMLKGYDRNHRTIPVKMWLDSPYYPFEK